MCTFNIKKFCYDSAVRVHQYFDEISSNKLPWCDVPALTWLRGSIEVHDEMDDMRNEYEAMKLVPKVTFKEMFVNATLRIPLMIAMMIMVAQQLSGINAVSVWTYPHFPLWHYFQYVTFNLIF